MRYPTGITKTYQSLKQYGNRGMGLESEINQSNEFYLLHNIAVIHKKPTPITIVNVDYKSRIEATIKEAYFKIPSTTDYNGIYRGKYLDFEAKETRQKSSFPLSNIHAHQMKHLFQIIEHGGIGFLIIRFCHYGETYLLEGTKLQTLLGETNRKSIPYSYIKQYGKLLKDGFQPRIDYLKIVDELYFKGDEI